MNSFVHLNARKGIANSWWSGWAPRIWYPLRSNIYSNLQIHSPAGTEANQQQLKVNQALISPNPRNHSQLWVPTFAPRLPRAILRGPWSEHPQRLKGKREVNKIKLNAFHQEGTGSGWSRLSLDPSLSSFPAAHPGKASNSFQMFAGKPLGKRLIPLGVVGSLSIGEPLFDSGEVIVHDASIHLKKNVIDDDNGILRFNNKMPSQIRWTCLA